MIKLIWAQTSNGVIGKENKLPWSIKAEMQHFKNTTLDSSVLMGRKTFESLNKTKLKNRINYVLTTNPKSKENNENDLFFINDLQDLITHFQNNISDHLFVIGGASLYQQMMPYANEVIRTVIKKDYEGNVKINELNFSDFDRIKIVNNDEFDIEYFKRKQNE